ncbi:MAG: glycosyl hydrolase 53 family protein [Candidatus Eisenbacteria bacterium]|uniref:Arabinogalactan endo-beta-1,4-galactanase n=1 Tax=Eiseniibacteriota bacterium TaxID=2212470 RepID=A0A933SDW4_UNCEI|nr:glycosyl hydrolase 53 family protein [Candidatus Eisenbacteria bacterium]
MKASRFAWIVLGALAAARVPEARAFEIGADLSSLPRVEAGGAVFSDGDTTADAITLLRRAGFTSVRLRLWHTPADGDCALAPTLALAKRAQGAGLRVLLDLHYSDTWADPAHQSPPAAWAALSPETLRDSVRAYTRDVLAAFVAQGTPPAWVQIGNEIDGGMLWESGRLRGGRARLASRETFARLVRAGADGAREASPGTKIVVHFSGGGDRDGAEEFFATLDERDVPFDVMAVSYYPWWHGTPRQLESTLRALASRFSRPVMVAETAQPWTSAWFDATHNAAGKLPAGAHPASPEGQAAFAAEVRAIVTRVSGGRGLGVWWWEPAWIVAPHATSPWENCTLFDEKGALLPAARALVQGAPVPAAPAAPRDVTRHRR